MEDAVSINDVIVDGSDISVQSLSHVELFATPWTTECQASLSISKSQSLLKHTSIEPWSWQDRENTDPLGNVLNHRIHYPRFSLNICHYPLS